MRIRSKLKINGKVEIKKYRDGKLISKNIYKNLITNTGKNCLNNVLGGLTYHYLYEIGIGTGTTAVEVTDTTIQDEILSKPFTSVEVSGGNLVITIYIEKSEGIGNWGNLGLKFENGVLFTHLNVTETKTTSDYITIIYTIN